MITLGKRVREITTGFEGIVVARCDYINGTTEYGVRPSSIDGTRPQVEYIDADLLTVVDDGITIKVTKPPLGFHTSTSGTK